MQGDAYVCVTRQGIFLCERCASAVNNLLAADSSMHRVLYQYTASS